MYLKVLSEMPIYCALFFCETRGGIRLGKRLHLKKGLWQIWEGGVNCQWAET